jgi:hypothetical protein
MRDRKTKAASMRPFVTILRQTQLQAELKRGKR